MSSDYIVNLQGENFPQFLPLGEVCFENNFNLSLDFYLVRPPLKNLCHKLEQDPLLRLGIKFKAHTGKDAALIPFQ